MISIREPAAFDGIGTDSPYIPAQAAIVIGYMDGRYAWTPLEWGLHAGAAKLRYSVLGDPVADGDDCETGNAGPSACAAAAVIRVKAGRFSIEYANSSTLPFLYAALGAQSGKPGFADPSLFPAPGVYVHDSDPTGVPHLNTGSLMTQWLWTPDFDVSAVHPQMASWLGARNWQPASEVSKMFLAFDSTVTPTPPATECWLVTASGRVYVDDGKTMANLIAKLGAPVPMDSGTLGRLPVLGSGPALQAAVQASG